MRVRLFEKSTATEETPEGLFQWHARPGAFERLVPPWSRMEVLSEQVRLEEGSRVHLRVYRGPVGLSWLAEHRNVRPSAGFEDIQVRGPFSLWEHEHTFTSTGKGRSLLLDRIRYALPGGRLGDLLGGPSIRRDLDRVFDYRHRTTLEDLRLHSRYADQLPLRVAISGAGGLIGSSLAALLASGGHEVIRLVRRRATARPDEASWDSEQGLLEPESLEGIDAVVHLAGENIGAGRWTRSKMERIRDSRVHGTRALVRSFGRLASPPKHFLCASAIGVYGSRGPELLTEQHPAGDGFLAQVCSQWESAAQEAENLGARVAMARFGVVLSPRGGALAKMLPAYLLGAGGTLGPGDQFVSWIGIDDAVAALLHILMTRDLSGPVNISAPAAVTQRELSRTLGQVLKRPTLAPMPAAAARLIFGKMAEETLLSSTRVVPSRLEESGYSFRQPLLEGALRHLLGRRAS